MGWALAIHRRTGGPELQIRPPPSERNNQNHQVDDKGNRSLLVQFLEYAIPEEKKDGCREYGRTYDHGAPPSLAQEDSHTANHESGGSQKARDACQPSCRFVSK
ncbi:hypothetical protein ACFLT5_02440 [Chloroflexota bacterium]